MRHPDERPDGERWTGADHPDEGTIHAWLDDALGPDEAAALERHVTGCAPCAAAVAEARGLIAASSQILARLDAVPGGVLPASPAGPTPQMAGATPEAATPEAATPEAATPEAATPHRGAPPAGAPPRSAGEESGVVPLAPRRRAPAPLWRRGAVRALAAVALLAVGVTAVLRETGGDRSLSEITATQESAPAMAGDAAAPAPEGAAGFAAPDSTTSDTPTSDTATAQSAAPVEPDRAAVADRARAADMVATESAPPPVAERAAPRPLAARKAGQDALAQAADSVPAGAAEKVAGVSLPVVAAAPAVAGGAQVDVPTARIRADTQRRAAAAAADLAVSAARREGLRGVPADTRALAPVTTGVAPAPAPPPPTPAGSTGTVRASGQRADSTVPRGRTVPRVAGVDSGVAVSAPVPAPMPPVPAAVERFAGCYRLSVRGAAGEVRDQIEGALPGWLLLDRASRSTAGWHVAASAADAEDDTPARWRVADVLVLVEWPIGGRVIDLRLRPWAEGLAGTAALRTAGERGEEVSVLARRVDCGGE